MRIIDRFPVAGDKGVIIDQDRGTEWSNRPVLASQPVLNGPGTLTTTHTNDSEICTKDLAMGGAGSNAAQCQSADWDDPFSANVAAAQMRVAFSPAIQPGQKVDITGREYKITGSRPITVEKLPVGALCWAVETDKGGADSTAVDHSSMASAVQLSGAETVAVTATNTFDAAALTVSKKVVNGGAGPYSFALSCTTTQGPVALNAADAAFSLKGGESRTVSVPQGSECAVAETDVPDGATAGIADSDGGHDGTMAVTGSAAVKVTNTFKTAPVAPGEDLSNTGAGGLVPMGAAAAVLLLAGGLILWRTRRQRT